MEIVIQVNGTPDMAAVVGGELRFYNPETDEHEVRPVTLGDLVAQKVADRIFAAYGREDLQSIWKMITRDREKIVRERLEPMLTEAINGEIHETNAYGERLTGRPPITLKEMIVKEAGKALTVRNRLDQKPSVLEQAVQSAVGAALTKELNEAIGAAKAEMVKAVRVKAAEFLTAEVLERKTR